MKLPIGTEPKVSDVAALRQNQATSDSCSEVAVKLRGTNMQTRSKKRSTLRQSLRACTQIEIKTEPKK